ncbi:hypothetical protein COK01_06100 [Priestia megaterium]|jgi:hypothetical protein|uniref:hypothetical protein n=1 Tax=Priestia megaterium TaxID=1404 RepID=UPI000BFA10C5|nr:hypothetical protein [Priestia megaterium]PFE31519.1 hypothetical protein CN270_14195 [Priestia megaterium]PFP50713.1 hypothetical protein COK01_06100 [Priestia megaterium]PGX21216.1 hypothetical protein COE08_06835 [Priestia megaterium]
MTVHHYIGSPYELPTGSFGIREKLVTLSEVSSFNRNPKKEKLITIYEKEEDAYGISINYLTDGYSDIKHVFTLSYIYELSCDVHPKSMRELFTYIEEHLIEGCHIELYSCLDGDEAEEKDSSLDTSINLKTLYFGKHYKLDKKKYIYELGEVFTFEDKQFVVVVK